MALLQVTESQLLDWLGAVLWPFLRIGAMLTAAPLFGSHAVPVRIRVALGFVLALALVGLLPTPPSVNLLSLDGGLAVARELLVGLLIGFVLQMVFSTLAMAGEIVSLAMGLAFASMTDPESGMPVPVIGEYYTVFATLIFLALDGHTALLLLTLDSFDAIPPAGGGLAVEGYWTLVGWGSEMFRGALFVALPAAASLLVVSVSMGVVARSAPQLNIFAVGFPMSLLLGLVFLLLSLPTLLPQFTRILESGFALTGALMGGAP